MAAALVLGKRGADAPRPEPVRVLASSSEIQQQHETIHRLRDAHATLTAKFNHAVQQHESAMIAMRKDYEHRLEVQRKDHALEKAGFEEELRRLKDQLLRIAAAAKEGSLISANSFAPTQFDDVEQPEAQGTQR
jgi:hypothetical protein